MYKETINVVITGATSFIGIHLIKAYLKNNCNVTAIVRPNSKNLGRLPQSPLLIVIEEDMSEIKSITNKTQNDKFDIFYHLAWEGARVPYRDDAVLQDKNYNCSINAMYVAKQLGCKTFIGTGSQAEYGKCSGKIDENYDTHPTTEYGKAKLRAYQSLSKMAKEYNMRFIWTRIFSVYGTYDYSGTLVMSVLDKMSRNQDIPLTPCIQSWDFIHVEDVATAMYLLGSTLCMEGIYNIASGKVRQLKEFVIAMKEISHSKSELQFGAISYNSEGVIGFEPVIDKLKQNLDWSCQVKFDQGIKKILELID